MSDTLHKEFFYPEHERLEKVQEVSQRIGEFLEWLSEKDIRMCEYLDEIDDEGFPMKGYWPIRDGIVELLARYFDINLKKIESEKQAMIQALRERNQNGDSD